MREKSLILANAVFKLIPTLLIVAYLWYLYAGNLTEIRTDPLHNLLVFAAGMFSAYFLYANKLRFSVSILLLTGGLYLIYHYLSSVTFGEFDTFYYSVSFFVYAVIFVIGWLVGFGFARIKSFAWLMAFGVFLFATSAVINEYYTLQNQSGNVLVRHITGMVLPGKSPVDHFITSIFLLLLPVMFYSIYLVAINEYLRKLQIFRKEHYGFLIRRIVLSIAVLIILMLLPLLYIYFNGVPEALVKQMSSAEAQSASFLKKTTNQSTQKPQFDLNDYAQLLPEVKLSDETVFATYIDNFYPTRDGGRIPLPVHFRRFVLNRYEPQTEKFVLDPYPPSSVPNDLFSPSIKDVPVGFAMWDSLIATSTEKYQYRRNIAATVFNQSLDPNAYVAPNTGWYYQKLPVAPEDRATFTTAYQCSSLISIWNLPPFMFSTTNPELLEFKEQRAEALRKDTMSKYARLDSIFYRYYTSIDKSDTLIIKLAEQLTADKPTPYDKVEAVVDYFLGKDESGNPRFTYTLKPGSPQRPGQSFMHYFLFENKAGYCTYFAGATVLLLRAAGIPARMAVGYAIYDRSNKNDGWYWVYADQGHAWVEVFFPSYGWVDFDTTPSDDTEPVRPPKPDATPPEVVGEPVFAVLGKVVGLPADSTQLRVKPYIVRYRTKEYEIPDSLAKEIILQPKQPNVTLDDRQQPIASIDLNRNVIVSSYSFDYQLQNLPKYNARIPFAEWFEKQFPDIIPVDEAIIVYRDETKSRGKVFAVEGPVVEILPDSALLVVEPQKIFFRERDYQPDTKYLPTVKIRPADSSLWKNGKAYKISDLTLAVGDTLRITAESSHSSLHKIPPFLATESFTTWFKNRFPEIIPVDKVTVKIPATPLSQRIFRWLMVAAAAVFIAALLLASLVYFYFWLRVRQSPGEKRLYWIYRFTLFLLNQLGFRRIVETPLEFAEKTVDPTFGTRFARFMTIYHKSKYSPENLSEEEIRFADEFVDQMKNSITQKYKKREIFKKFLNPIPTLRYLLVKS